MEALRAVWRSQAALLALKFPYASTDSRREGASDTRALPLACQCDLWLGKQSSGSRSPNLYPCISVISVTVITRVRRNRRCSGCELVRLRIQTELRMLGVFAPSRSDEEVTRSKGRILMWRDDEIWGVFAVIFRFYFFPKIFFSAKPERRLRSLTYLGNRRVWSLAWNRKDLD